LLGFPRENLAGFVFEKPVPSDSTIEQQRQSYRFGWPFTSEKLGWVELEIQPTVCLLSLTGFAFGKLCRV